MYTHTSRPAGSRRRPGTGRPRSRRSGSCAPPEGRGPFRAVLCMYICIYVYYMYIVYVYVNVYVLFICFVSLFNFLIIGFRGGGLFLTPR